jgi:hypothetical protein
VRQATVDQFDSVIEAVGKPEVWEAAVRLVRKGGAVNFFGGCPSGTSITLDTTLIHYSNLTLLASFHHTPRTIRRALEFIEAGVIHSRDFVDGECSLAGLRRLFKAMSAGNQAVKTLIRVREWESAPGPVIEGSLCRSCSSVTDSCRRRVLAARSASWVADSFPLRFHLPMRRNSRVRSNSIAPPSQRVMRCISPAIRKRFRPGRSSHWQSQHNTARQIAEPSNV